MWITIQQQNKAGKGFTVHLNLMQLSYVQTWAEKDKMGIGTGYGQVVIGQSVFTILSEQDKSTVEKSLRITTGE